MTLASNSVVAKVRAVFGKTLRAEDYIQLVTKETVGDVCAYLKQTPSFEASLVNANPQTIHRGQLENILRRSVYDIFDHFRRFDFTQSVDFFHFILARLEVEQIILAVESVAAGGNDEFIASLPSYFIKSSSVDLANLGTAKSMVEATDILRPTHYFKAIGNLMIDAVENGDFNIGEFERRIKTHYYMRLLKVVDKELKGTERKEFRRLVLRSVDMANVVTLYRYAAIFGASREDIPLIDFRYRLSEDVIERLVHEDSADKIATELAYVGYNFEGDVPATIEILTERISLDFIRKAMHLSTSPAVAYFALSESLTLELSNIKTLIEGIRYKVDSEKILEMMVY